jgi:hypothetical protein
VQDDALTALYQENDGRMDEVSRVARRCGADIVCLALGRTDSATSGLSFLLDTTDDQDELAFAFSVIQYPTSPARTLPHELGHVFGCAHDRENALSGAGAQLQLWLPVPGADGRQYHDIMSYPPGTELAYFSNPAIVVPEPVNARWAFRLASPGSRTAR